MGDVYRKDEIDSKHYPVFHQMEMFIVLEDNEINPVDELKKILSGLVKHLFPDCEYRFNGDYFPFTDPSFEIEVRYQNEWMEILGCGIVQPAILETNNILNKKAIAAGFGIDRLAMILFSIPDIRYLWSSHPRFLDQFADGNIKEFVPYSELPNQHRDISFYISQNTLSIDEKTHKQLNWSEENDFFELIRECSGDIMEEAKLFDSYYHAKTNKYSRTYRVTYSPTNPDMNNGGEFFKLCNEAQRTIHKVMGEKLAIQLR